MARTRAVLVLLLAVAPVVAVGCTSHHQGAQNTTVPASPAVLHLLADLRSVPFRSPLPPHLRVPGVGTSAYIDAGHVGSGYVGSAQVLIRSSIEGETITAIYDVFTTAPQARARFSLAESNFSRFSRHLPAGVFRLVHLSPAVSAFCAPQVPAGTTTCWFNDMVTNGIVTTTAPPAYSGDGPAVLQALLSHVRALTGVRGHLPVHRGGRRSAKARTPSRASSEVSICW